MSAFWTHSTDVPDHVVLCTHANNTPSREVPAAVPGDAAAKGAAAAARSKNRRITIEDLVVDKLREGAE